LARPWRGYARLIDQGNATFGFVPNQLAASLVAVLIVHCNLITITSSSH
jgi:hypothetical protein